MFRNWYMTSLLGVLLLLLSTSQAFAGEWYIRGSMSLERSRSADFFDADSMSANPPALFGSGSGSDGRPIGAYGDFDTFEGFEAAVGRYLFPWLRTDLSVNYRRNMDYEGQANFTGVSGDQPVSGEADSAGIMVNAFLEVSHFMPLPPGRLRPYIGAGLGVTWNRMDRMIYEFPGLTTHKLSITPEGEKRDLSYMVTLGTGIVLTDSITLDVAYRYTDFGHIQTDQGNMYMNHVPAGITIGETEARLRCHGVNLGIRYDF